MEKKIFDAPYLKVVEVKNDVLTSSLNDTVGDGEFVSGRRGFEGDFEE